MSRIELVRAEKILEEIFTMTNPDNGHGLSHAIIVHNHAVLSIKEHPEKISEDDILSIELAALLHDVGDSKFVENVSIGYWEGYFFDKYFNGERNSKIFDTTMSMISIVSCSKCGDKYVGGKTWFYIPRYSDRLESIGEIGLQRAIIYSVHKGRPMYEENTKKATTLESLRQIAGRDRYEKYVASGGKPTQSDTTIDHLYDKPLHIDIPCWMKNPYFQREFTNRRLYLEKWIIEYWLSIENI